MGATDSKIGGRVAFSPFFADVKIKMGARFRMSSGKVIFVFANIDLCPEFGKVYGIHIIPKIVFLLAWFGVCV